MRMIDLSARLKKGALAIVVASLAVTASSVLAERVDRSGVDVLNGQRLSLTTCAHPDAQTMQAILPIATDQGSHATGVVYDDNRVLTAAHAVAGGGQFFVRVGESYRTADLVMVDSVNDLAVLAVNTQSIRPLHISGFEPFVAQPVWAVGYPKAQSIVTSMGVFQDNQEGALHTSASIESGQSGGGLLGCTNGVWELLGMLRGYGAYLKGGHYEKIANHSVSVAAVTINQFLLTYH